MGKSPVRDVGQISGSHGRSARCSPACFGARVDASRPGRYMRRSSRPRRPFQPAPSVLFPKVRRDPTMPRYMLQFSYTPQRSEEHTSELQSRLHLVCRLLLEKKKKNNKNTNKHKQTEKTRLTITYTPL